MFVFQLLKFLNLSIKYKIEDCFSINFGGKYDKLQRWFFKVVLYIVNNVFE